MAPDALAQGLRPLANVFDPELYPQLLVGLARADDAAVWHISDELALIATVDFFTPIVDDPYQFGAVAAANALSDVYAMGGRAALALNVCCLSGCLPLDVISEILRGGAEKVAEAGAVLVGGHSVSDKEPKYGLVALGFVHPDRVWTKGGARPGDILVLTKPLGVGVITTAAKGDHARAQDYEAAVASMLQLNKTAAEVLQHAAVHACTDVTGFSLLGHSSEMAEHGAVRLRFWAEQVPFLPGATDYAAQGRFPGGTKRNRDCFGSGVRLEPGIDEATQNLLFTPETSGGLLAAVAPNCLADMQRRFADAGQMLWVVGDVLPAAGAPRVEVLATRP
jgi:selenide,water dikinase